MYLVEQHIITQGDRRYKMLDRICFLSKNLYNAGLYVIKQEFLNTGKWIRCTDLNKKMVSENNPDFRALSGSSSQQILMGLDKNLKSYFSSIKAWKRDNKKFTGCPKFPKYKDKVKGRNVFNYSYAQIRHRGEYIYFPKKEGLPPLKTKCEEGSVKQVRIIPRQGCYVIELVYESCCKKQKVDNNRIMSIDLGVNNLASVVTNVSNKPVLIDGRKLKSINQYYNKKRSFLQSKLEKVNGKKNSRRLASLTRKRNSKVRDYLHKASKKIIDICVEDNITTLIIGHNDGWKQEVNIGKRSNQNFVFIPFGDFISMLKYKSERQGLRFFVVNESHTSKCSSYEV